MIRINKKKKKNILLYFFKRRKNEIEKGYIYTNLKHVSEMNRPNQLLGRIIMEK